MSHGASSGGRCILALDQGTSSSRAVLFDANGRTVASEKREFPQIYPQPGWVEHDPEAIWASQLESAQALLGGQGPSISDIVAIGITNQRETAIVWDRSTGEPVSNAIVWQCRRTAGMCERLRHTGLEREVRGRTGLVIDAYFSATKVQWLLDNVAGARQRAEAGQLAFGTVDSWLIWKLTGGGVHAIDATNASRTMLLNIHSGSWDDELLRIFDVPRSMLPEVVDSSGVIGACDASFFGASIPIAGVAGDQQAALFGQACFRAGDAKNTYGTGSFLLLHTGEREVTSTRLLTTIASRIGGKLQYALEGSIFATGAAVQWLRDGLKIIERAEDIEALAASVDDTGGVYMVPAFVGLGAPHWDPYARGVIVGLTRGTGRAHIARATLESVALQTCDVLDAIEADSGIRLDELRVDGGAARNDLLMQIQADLLGRPVVRSAEIETTALGAAYLAGLGFGVWSDLDDIRKRWQAERTFVPQISEDRRAAIRADWARAVNRSRGWVIEQRDD